MLLFLFLTLLLFPAPHTFFSVPHAASSVPHAAFSVPHTLSSFPVWLQLSVANLQPSSVVSVLYFSSIALSLPVPSVLQGFFFKKS